MGFGPLFYLLWGFRFGFLAESADSNATVSICCLLNVMRESLRALASAQIGDSAALVL